MLNTQKEPPPVWTKPCPLCGTRFPLWMTNHEEKTYWHEVWCRALANMPTKTYKSGRMEGQKYGSWPTLGRALDYSSVKPGSPVWFAWSEGRKPQKKRVKKLLLLASTGPMTPAFLEALEKIKG